MMRTLVDEGLEGPALVQRLNHQVMRHAPRSRFVTLFVGMLNPGTGELSDVNAEGEPFDENGVRSTIDGQLWKPRATRVVKSSSRRRSSAWRCTDAKSAHPSSRADVHPWPSIVDRTPFSSKGTPSAFSASTTPSLNITSTSPTSTCAVPTVYVACSNIPTAMPPSLRDS